MHFKTEFGKPTFTKTKGADMKQLIFVMTLVWAIIASINWNIQSTRASEVDYKVANLSVSLEYERAIAATGPCGNQFAVSGLGNKKDRSVVAGRIVATKEVGRFFQEQVEIDGGKDIALYVKVDRDKVQFLFRRHLNHK